MIFLYAESLGLSACNRTNQCNASRTRRPRAAYHHTPSIYGVWMTLKSNGHTTGSSAVWQWRWTRGKRSGVVWGVGRRGGVGFSVKADHLIPQTKLHSNRTVKQNFSGYALSRAGIPNYKKKSILFDASVFTNYPWTITSTLKSNLSLLYLHISY